MSPVWMSLLLLLVVRGWDGFSSFVGNSKLPVPILVILCGKCEKSEDSMIKHTLINTLAIAITFRMSCKIVEAEEGTFFRKHTKPVEIMPVSVSKIATHTHTHKLSPTFVIYSLLLFHFPIALPFCVLLFFLLSRKRPPHWFMQILLMFGAFAMSIAWLNLLANEIVSVLQAMGLLVGVSTGEGK